MKTLLFTITLTLLTGCLFSNEEKETKEVNQRCVPMVDQGGNEVGYHCFKEGEEGFDVDEQCKDVLNDKGVAIGRSCVKDGVERLDIKE